MAESLTGGQLVACLAAAEGASTWLRGGIVAYQPGIKREVLDVPPGPVVSAQTATAMAEGIAELMDAHLAIAVTGVGGPDPHDGQPAGTVWLAVSYRGETEATLFHFGGSPIEVCRETTAIAISRALERLS